MERTRKHSRKRDAILDCIRRTKCHPTADWVYQQLKPEFPDLSLGTVYRNIAMFKEEGVIQSIGVVNGLERFDYRTAPHIHLEEIGLPEEVLRQTEACFGGRITGFQLQFSGQCADCAEAQVQQ